MKSLIRIALAAAMLVPVGILTAGPAGAASPSCAKQAGSATITPALPLTKAANVTIKATTTLTGCKGAPGITSGKGTATLLQKNASCKGLISGNQSQTLSETITWNNKTTSTFTGTSKTGTGAKIAQVKITGTITKGAFLKSKVSTTISFVPTKGDCVKTGVSALKITGVGAFVF